MGQYHVKDYQNQGLNIEGRNLPNPLHKFVKSFSEKLHNQLISNIVNIHFLNSKVSNSLTFFKPLIRYKRYKFFFGIPGCRYTGKSHAIWLMVYR